MAADQSIRVAVELGRNRAFASAIEWPGWTRSGKGEDGALQALLEYGSRYEHALRGAGLGFAAPKDAAAFTVVERLQGDATTDFGAPDMAPAADNEALDPDGLRRLTGILAACWDGLSEALQNAEGKSLRKGPRGGGRPAEKIAEHVTGAHASYLRRIYWREKAPKTSDVADLIAAFKAADRAALEFAVSEEMPETGPRGGALWKPRYFVRRAAWHILDHAWEIEDRIE